ncbi:DNA double-strand break repair and VJ recombination XRCC4 N-terminal [Penicillium sp. IBT 18751x]|nr:DNA double-strand break repair and VJ recombination XRCC4 N-terminal [Penicillium sp. IBT 18751x]
MSPKWHRLQISGAFPPLLFQYSWTRQGYELHVTDLTSIWSEQLPHKEIAKRAEQSATSIDPSEGAEQLQVFLSKIGEALRGDGGSAKLHRGPYTDSLELTTSTRLPAPLKPLRWTLYLTKEPPSAFTSRLLLPLLTDETSWESRQRALLDQIKQKDWVLGKLLDKVEALQIDLGTVFPAAAGLRSARKGSTRSEAARHIKGVAPFNEQKWLAESRVVSSAISGVAANIAHELLGSNDQDLEGLHPPQTNWWYALARRSETSFSQEIESESQSGSQNDAPVMSSQAGVDIDSDATAESEDDEFQRQATPPKFDAQETRSLGPTSKTKETSPSLPPLVSMMDMSTASEIELDRDIRHEAVLRRKRTPGVSPPPRPATPPPQPKVSPKKARGGLGVIGGKKKKAETPQPEPEPHSSPPQPRPAQIAEPSHPPFTQTKRPAKLGMIGGKSKAKLPNPSEAPSAQPGSVLRSPESAGPSSTTAMDDYSQSPEKAAKIKQQKDESPENHAIPEATPLTEAEKANRKREELKRQLEAQSKAPTKKKRRF